MNYRIFILVIGTFIIGTVHLQSHITLYLQSGFILKGSTHLSDYENFFFFFSFIPIHKGMFFTENKEDIIITGEGRIDGSGIFFFDTTQQQTYVVTSFASVQYLSEHFNTCNG